MTVRHRLIFLACILFAVELSILLLESVFHVADKQPVRVWLGSSSNSYKNPNINFVIKEQALKDCLTEKCRRQVKVNAVMSQMSKSVEVPCRWMRVLGDDDTAKEGSWYGQAPYRICMDEPFRITPGNCIVYSFGILDDWSFEDDIAITYSCNVSAFDPSLDLSHHVRPSGVVFWPFGLYNVDADAKPLEGNPFTNRNPSKLWTMKTLGGIAKFLGDTDSTIIDVVKLDIEESEFPALEQALDSGFLQKRVGHLLVEWHLFQSDSHGLHEKAQGMNETKLDHFLKIYSRLHDLDDGGFAVMFAQQRERYDIMVPLEYMVNMRLYANFR